MGISMEASGGVGGGMDDGLGGGGQGAGEKHSNWNEEAGGES